MSSNRSVMVRGSDGKFYYKDTRWDYILDNLADALGCFSEFGSQHSAFYQRINALADEIYDLYIKPSL